MNDRLTFQRDPNFTGEAKAELAALVMLRRLHAHGVDYFFCNPGTDFPAIIEAFSMAQADPEIGKSIPRPIVVTHENAAVAIAHGVFLVTGRPQAVKFTSTWAQPTPSTVPPMPTATTRPSC